MVFGMSMNVFGSESSTLLNDGDQEKVITKVILPTNNAHLDNGSSEKNAETATTKQISSNQDLRSDDNLNTEIVAENNMQNGANLRTGSVLSANDTKKEDSGNDNGDTSGVAREEATEESREEVTEEATEEARVEAREETNTTKDDATLEETNIATTNVVETENESASNITEEANQGSVVPHTSLVSESHEQPNDNAKEVTEQEPADGAVGNTQPDQTAEQEYQEKAMKLFNDEFVTIQPEEYTRYLAADDYENSQILQMYMDLFKWKPNLLASTRMLCSKLYLKGESQEIDRILSSFTKSYVKQHPKNIFCTNNFEKLYIVLYSLILLNTALHNNELNRRNKISQSDYIKNTFTTFVNQDPKRPKKLSIAQRMAIEKELSVYYDDLANNELHLKQSNPDLSFLNQSRSRVVSGESVASSKRQSVYKNEEDHRLSRQASDSSIWSTDTNSNRRSLLIQRTPSGASAVTQSTFTGQQNQRNARVGFTRALASEQKQMTGTYNANNYLRNIQSLDPMKNSNNNLLKKSSRSSIISNNTVNSNFQDDNISLLSFANDIEFFKTTDEESKQPMEHFDVDDYQDQYDLTLELQGSPYLKEGILKLKILNDDQQENNPEVSRKPTTNPSEWSFRSLFRTSSYQSTPNVNFTSLGGGKFTENFVVVSKGELSIYSFDPKVVKKHQQKEKKLKQRRRSRLIDIDDINSMDEQLDEVVNNVGDGNWLKNAAKIGTYNLCSTFAQFERHSSGFTLSTSPSKKTIIWSLSFPRISNRLPKKFLFEAGTRQIAAEFINTCNFWASKITAIPTSEESVSSIEYGWTNLDKLIARKEEFKKLKNISKWEQLPKGVYLSNYTVNNDEDDTRARHLGMMRQFVKTVNYYNSLKMVLADFSKMKMKFIKNLSSKNLSGSSNYNRVVTNFENKSSDYQAELKKYREYLIMLGFALQLRFDLQEENDECLMDDIYDSGAADILETNISKTEENDLERAVRLEVQKLFSNMKNISKLIPNYLSSKTINEIVQAKIPSKGKENTKPFPLVKSPKTFTLSNYNNNESPIAQLLESTNEKNNAPIIAHSYSTGTIKEEEESEDPEESRSTAVHIQTYP